MVTGIILGWILSVLETPTIIWVAYGTYWLAWFVKLVTEIIKAVLEKLDS